MERYLPTGNEQISIPRLNEVTAAIEDITFLYMACRGLLDLRGGKAPVSYTHLTLPTILRV